MNTYIALLRGINVGGHKKIKMAELRAHLSELGFDSINTYIQSGNIVFKAVATDIYELEDLIFQKIKEKYPFEARVMVLSRDDWEDAFEKNPFLPEKEEEIKALHLTYFEKEPDWEAVDMPSELDWDGNSYICQERRMYMYLPHGMSKSGLEKVFPERKLKMLVTTRNWKTVTKLLEMTREA